MAKVKHPVSKESCVAFEDFARMHLQQHKASGERRLPTPLWAVRDEMLKELLVVFLEERAGFRKPQSGSLSERLEKAQRIIINQRPRLIATLDKLCNEYVLLKKTGTHPEMSDVEVNASLSQPLVIPQLARKYIEAKRLRELSIEIEGIDSFLKTTEKDGGAATITGIIYYFYRACLDSPGVAHLLNIKPPSVRQTLFRLYQTAKKLWPETAEESQELPPMYAAMN